MIKECLEVFASELEKKGAGLILDTYVPADGTYLIVDSAGSVKTFVDIRRDKKTNTVDRSHPEFPRLCRYDYHSQLISMNKPMDGKKIIHSNNYLSFWVKKESIISGKLTDEVIEDYYEVLKNPVEKKYKKEAGEIYKLFEEREGAVSQEAIEENKRWIKEHIYSLEGVDMSRKDYLKIFFEAEQEVYEREGRRYCLPNIYNSNEYNVKIENVVYGLPDNNVGMNAKKPFLSIKTRKYPAPYILNGEEVMLQKQFFDYLMNQAAARKYNIYVDTAEKEILAYANGEAPEKVETGYYLRLKKGKNEAEIHDQDNMAGYKQELEKPFEFQNVLQEVHSQHPEYHEKYGLYGNRLKVGALIGEVFFSNYLAGNYSTEAKDIRINDGILKQNLILSRDVLFDWVYKGIDRGFEKVLEQTSFNLIKGALLNGYRERALWQLNLRESFIEYFSKEGERNMGEIISGMKKSIKDKVLSCVTVPLEEDDEYYYAVGQMAAYLISLNKSREKKQSLINPFLNAKTNEMIKTKLLQYYKKYNHDISEQSRRVKNLMAMIEGYVPGDEVNQEMIVLGYATDNVIYIKEDKQ